MSETNLRTIQSQLKDKQKKLDRLDDEILGLISEEGEADDCVKEGKEAGQFRSKVKAAIMQIQDRLDRKLQRSGSIESLSSTATLITRKVRARLPKLDMRKFSGKPYDWQEFWDAFRSSVHENEELCQVDKFTYLHYLLEEPVKTVIAGFSLTEANYEAAVDLLKHINELMNLQPVYKERDLDRLRHFYDVAETHFRGLDAMMVDETTYSSSQTLLVRLECRQRVLVEKAKMW